VYFLTSSLLSTLVLLFSSQSSYSCSLSIFLPVNADLHSSQQTKDQTNLITSDLASAIDAAPQSSTSSETGPHQMKLESNKRFQEAIRQKVNLERELQLMASAWYDQNTRLMSNAVNTSMHRGRPPSEPRSFLGKQRRLIDGVLTGRS
jgi:hypothetical protein